MKLPFSGGCLCGAVRYSCSVEPELMYYCHCSDCRKVSGAAFYPGVYVERKSFAVTGNLSSYFLTADSGRTIHRYSCPTCAGQIYSDKGADTAMLSIKAGTLDDVSLFKPTIEIWAQSKVEWANLPSDLDSHKRGYGE